MTIFPNLLKEWPRLRRVAESSASVNLFIAESKERPRLRRVDESPAFVHLLIAALKEFLRLRRAVEVSVLSFVPIWLSGLEKVSILFVAPL